MVLNLKRSIGHAVKLSLLLLAGYGLFRVAQDVQFSWTKFRVEKIEANRDYESDLLWNLPHGRPVFMVKPANKTTLFFFEGFRSQVGSGQYRDLFERLHKRFGVNVIAPLVGLQGWPFLLRTRQWTWHEDMRQALQIYDAYAAAAPMNQKIYVASTSFGAIANATICAKSFRRPDGAIFISPLNTGLSYEAYSPLVRFFATQTSWLRFFIPFNWRAPAPNRASVWDVVDAERNLAILERMGGQAAIVNPEDNIDQGYTVNRAAKFLEERLVPQIHHVPALVMYGDSDLVFTQDAYKGFADLLRTQGNPVSELKLQATGHMPLLDSGQVEAERAFTDMLTRSGGFQR